MEQAVAFGPQPGASLVYRLESSAEARQVRASFADGRLYLGQEVLSRSRLVLVSTGNQEKEDPGDSVGAISA